MATPNIYILPGLGLDERLFFKWELNSNSINFINWIEPASMSESLVDYCKRLATQIKQQENIVLIGVSFGGIAAQEIAKFMDIQQIILVSSIKKGAECPITFQIMKRLPLYQWSSPKIRHYTRKIWGRLFGLMNKESLDFFEDMFEKSSERYKTWGVKQIANWENESYPSNLRHIHGTKDLIFPYSLLQSVDLKLEGASHGAVVTHATKICNFINTELNLISSNSDVEIEIDSRTLEN